MSRLDRDLRRETGEPAARLARELLAIAERDAPLPNRARSTDLIAWIESLISRRRRQRAEAAIRAAARAYPRLTPDAQAEVYAAIGSRLRDIVCAFVESPDEAPRLAAARLAGASGDPGLLTTVAGLVSDGRASVSESAGSALVALSRAWLTESAQRTSDEAERVVSAVCSAADSYPSHRRLDAVRAALLLMTPAVRRGSAGTTPASWLDEADEATRMAIRAAIKSLPADDGAARAWELIPRADIGRAAAERCADAMANTPEALASAGHLVLRRERAAAWKERVGRERAATALPNAHALAAWPVEARRGWSRLVGALPIDPAARTDAMEPLLADPDDAARMAAACRANGSVLADFTLDPHQAVASAALARLAFDPRVTASRTIIADRRRVDAVLPKSQHETVRRFGPRWLGPALSAGLAGRHWSPRMAMAQDPAGTVQVIRDGVRDGALAAIQFVNRLAIADQMLPELRDAIGLSDARLASSAARALGESRAPEVSAWLAVAATAEDPRLRSNAIESIERRRRRGIEPPALPEMRDGDHHRPRTAWMLARLRAGQPPAAVVAEVKSLLSSEACTPRLAGLWLVERGARELKPAAGRGWTDVAAMVAELARSGETEHERARATRCARRMLAEIKT